MLASCKDNIKKTTEQQVTGMISWSSYLERRDTMAVETLVSLFMERVMEHKYDSAVALLRHVEKGLPEAPVALAENEFRQAMRMLQMFPVHNYEIVNMSFCTADDNWVKCKVITDSGLTVNWIFAPVRYLGRWSLCLKVDE